MAKNENGIPIFDRTAPCCTPCASSGIVGGVSGENQNGGNHNGCSQNGCSQNGCCQNGGNQNGNQNGGVVGGITNSGCGGRGDCLDEKPLAYVYAPDQRFRMLYSAKDALSHGTLFEELYKPKGVYGNE